MQEVDLTGNVIFQMSAAQLNSKLASAACSGCNLVIDGTHHDFIEMANGHLILLVALHKTVSGPASSATQSLIWIRIAIQFGHGIRLIIWIPTAAL